MAQGPLRAAPACIHSIAKKRWLFSKESFVRASFFLNTKGHGFKKSEEGSIIQSDRQRHVFSELRGLVFVDWHAHFEGDGSDAIDQTGTEPHAFFFQP